VYEPISVYGNYYVGVDGEGVGDDYVLLDSSLSEYPRLYTGKRLTTQECLDWLWGLAHAAGYCSFVLYGAGYDFNNWMRDIPFEDVKRLATSKVVRYGDYLILWQAHFKFAIRKIADEDITKEEYSKDRYRYARIQTRLGEQRQDITEVVFWDVLPFWQTTFVKALAMTLKERTIEKELIEEGKEARGTFTHENIEWVSKYNRAECENLARMMVELDTWFSQSNIRPLHYNGPGSAAKAMLRTHSPYYHAGRKINNKERSIARKVGAYHFPGADDNRSMMFRALCAYAGALNRQLKIGYWPGDAYQYDLVSAYPSAMLKLPCLSHGFWDRTRHFDMHSFGLWRVRYNATRRMQLYPFFWRTPDGSIEYPASFEERWAHTYEVAAALAVDAAGVRILDGWKWTPTGCNDEAPFWWVGKDFLKRQEYKRVGNDGASNGLKLPLNSLYGSIAQARGGTASNPPWSQQILWAGAITAYTRARLYLAYQTNPSAVVHMATDGIISVEELPLREGSGLGEWEVTHLEDLTVIQYGVYNAIEWKEIDGQRWGIPRHRERGFRLSEEEVPEFNSRVHAMWRTGKWESLHLSQKVFITCGLVAQSEARYEEWCTWQDQTRIVELDQASIFKIGHVKGVPGLWDIQDSSHELKKLGASAPYEPKWGKGDDYPQEFRLADLKEEALEVSA
jgi:hypothetical protein